MYGIPGTENDLDFIIRDNERLKIANFPNLLAYGSPDMAYTYIGQEMSINENPQLEKIVFPKIETILYKKPMFFVGFLAQNNPKLRRVQMPNLINVNNGAIKVYGADLEVLDSFDRMERGGISFEVGPHLQVINTFEKLKVAYGLSFYGDSLQKLPEFLNLDTIGISSISYDIVTSIITPMLKKWPAFPKLTADYSYAAWFSGNDSLQTMTFPALKRVNNVRIFQNNHLQSLDGFSTVEKVTTGFTVQDNPQLVDCSAICAMLAAGVPPAVFHLGNNAMECDTLTAVATYCDTVSVAVGEPSALATGPLSALRLSPNPATYTVHIGWEGAPPPDVRFDWTFYSVQGKVLQQGIYTDDQTDISVANYPPGLYFLRLRDPSSGAMATRRLGVLRP